jgi:Ca-activated chloride channel family protein
MGIRIYTIGIGTPEGAPISIGGDFIRDEKGEMVVSKLNEEMLRQIADLTDGLYVRSSLQSIGLDEIVQSIEAMEKTELSTVRFEEYNEQYPLLVAIALVLLLVEFLLLDRRNPLLAHLNIFRE